jgi:hypothetical protein
MVILLEKMKVVDGPGEVERGSCELLLKMGGKRMVGLVRIILRLNLRD